MYFRIEKRIMSRFVVYDYAVDVFVVSFYIFKSGAERTQSIGVGAEVRRQCGNKLGVV